MMEWISALERTPPEGKKVLLTWVSWHCSVPLYYFGHFESLTGQLRIRVYVSGQLQHVNVSDGQVYWMEIPPHPAAAEMKERENASQRAFLKRTLAHRQAKLVEMQRRIEEVR